MEKRIVFRYRGSGQVPAEDVRAIRTTPSAKVVDCSDRMLLVDLSQPDLDSLRTRLNNWAVAEEQFVPLPKPPSSVPIVGHASTAVKRKPGAKATGSKRAAAKPGGASSK